MQNLHMLKIDDLIRLYIRNWTYCWEQSERRTTIGHYGQTNPVDYGFIMGGRRYEFFIWGKYIKKDILNTLQQYKEPFYISYFSDNPIPEAIIKDYYFIAIDYLMTANLADLHIGKPTSNLIHRIRTERKAHDVNLKLFYISKSERLKMIKPDRLADPHLRFHYLETNDGAIAASGSYSLIDELVLLDNIYTKPKYRRNGFAEILCRKMLFDAKKEGAKQSIIASSEQGRSLYKRLGYKDVQKIYIYSS